MPRVTAAGADVCAGCVRGALHAGIIGEDLLLEEDPDVYELLLDLGADADAIVYATPCAATLGRERSRPRVATPYPRVTRRHFGATGRQVEAVAFGAAALAPALGVAEGVVDLRSRVAARRSTSRCRGGRSGEPPPRRGARGARAARG